ncbi:hypothetical protein QR98_0062820 [Sarcoptes scabiei]|uniref:Uncharacterized protein n=1 Tax=Sarcoptes scabiei TaxID=52283 RepID=A0A132ABF4_SARSC|nr:hypothetical protein QR98_0062820 [Sarcoptes scabiei]
MRCLEFLRIILEKSFIFLCNFDNLLLILLLPDAIVANKDGSKRPARPAPRPPVREGSVAVFNAANSAANGPELRPPSAAVIACKTVGESVGKAAERAAESSLTKLPGEFSGPVKLPAKLADKPPANGSIDSGSASAKHLL